METPLLGRLVIGNHTSGLKPEKEASCKSVGSVGLQLSCEVKNATTTWRAMKATIVLRWSGDEALRMLIGVADRRGHSTTFGPCNGRERCRARPIDSASPCDVIA